MGEGWAAVAHGTIPSLDALSVRVGVIVATSELDAAAVGFADDGFQQGDEDLLGGAAFDSAALALAKKRLLSGQDAALALVRDLGLAVYDAAKPAVWLLVTGGQTRAIVVDAGGKKHGCSAEGDPRQLKLPRGTHRLAAF